jgi:hypothetical protein
MIKGNFGDVNKGLRIHFGALKRFQKKFHEVFGKDADCGQYIKEILKTSASRCLHRTEQRTPVDTGQLRANWEAETPKKAGWDYRVKIKNDVEYATYVEFGHRPNWQGMIRGKKNKQGVPKLEFGDFEMEDGTPAKAWVDGYFMLTKSMDETRQDLPKVAEEVLTKKLRELGND